MSFSNRAQEDDMIRLGILHVKIPKGVFLNLAHNGEEVEILEDCGVHSSAKCRFVKTGEVRIVTLYEHQPVYEKAKIANINIAGSWWDGKHLYNFKR